MTRADDGELRSLQARVYGPHADIQLDPDALRRLRELEGTTGGRAEPAPPVATGASSARSTWVRRPGVPVVLALVLAAALVVAGLILLRPNPSALVRPTATQLARLPEDPGYKIAPFVGGPGLTSSSDAQAFREFHGLRAVILPSLTALGAATGDACIAVYPSAEVEADEFATGYTGHVWTGCAAGGFPATVQFGVTSDLPPDVRAGFPAGEALKFVYDSPHHDIVVFGSR